MIRSTLTLACMKGQVATETRLSQTLLMNGYCMECVVSNRDLNVTVSGMGKEVENLLTENKQLLETKYDTQRIRIKYINWKPNL